MRGPANPPETPSYPNLSHLTPSSTPSAIRQLLRKSSSLKKPADPIPNISQLRSSQMQNPIVKLSPMKKRSRSQQKDLELFSNSKRYADKISAQGSMLFSHISQATESIASTLSKQVKFRDTLIMRNTYSRRDKQIRESRTPSILKRSQLLRNNCSQFMQQNAQIHPERQASVVEDREERINKTNEVVKKRFLTIIQRFSAKHSAKMRKGLKLRSDEMYRDELFPPIASSIQRQLKNKDAKLDKIKWVRLSQLFKGRPLTIANPDQKSNLLITCQHNCNNFIGEAFNCIKNCRCILSKMFQAHQSNDFGIYLVKIFQENVWKFTVIDDYIPVIEHDDGVLRPYYINSTQIQHDKTVEIWPFLLEKAYASYYGNYESLHYGNTLDFLQEITGTPGEMFHHIPQTKKNNDRNKRLKKLLDLSDSIILGYLQSQKIYVPIQRNQDGNLTTFISKEASTFEIHVDNIYQYFDKVFVFNPQGNIYSAVSAIGVNIKKNQNIYRCDVSLRTLRLAKGGTVSISIRQKQKRFYQKSSLVYEYIWVRVIILQKEFDGDCRWIDGRYSNNKSLNFFTGLQAGQYYLIILPQWKSSHCYELSCIVNSNTPIQLIKQQYDDNSALLQKGCCDLAQRMGKLHQINPYACSYSYIHEQLGLLVQNINNQRYNGDIKINRAIGQLRASVDLIPFNKQFYQYKNSRFPIKNQISVYIPADFSFTVILMTRGGIDTAFLRNFDFGQ